MLQIKVIKNFKNMLHKCAQKKTTKSAHQFLSIRPAEVARPESLDPEKIPWEDLCAVCAKRNYTPEI